MGLNQVPLLLIAFVAPVFAAPAFAGGPVSFTTHHDTIPNFAHDETIASVQDGAWSSPSTWSPVRVPNASDIVLVAHDVQYDSITGIADVVGIASGARLGFATDQDTRLEVTTLLVMPGGALEIGTAGDPVEPGFTSEVVIRNLPLDVAGDPDQYSNGLLCIDGRVTIHGAPRLPTFVRTATAPLAGASALVSVQPLEGWQPDDVLVLPDSEQPLTESSGVPDSYNYEELTLQSLSPDGLTLAISPALAFDHPGTSDEDSNGLPDYLPHVMNLERNVQIRSASRTGTRGHVFLTARSQVDIRFAAFIDLGRTTFEDLDPTDNHIGRYALHLHHLYGPYPPVDPQFQFRLIGNAVFEDAATTPPQKWGIALHDSHYGLVADNVVYNVGGAGIVTEDGSESFNVIERNMVVRVLGNGGRSEIDVSGRGVAREGVGFWFRGTNNHVRDNVAANMIEGDSEVEAAYGFKYNMTYLGAMRIPDFRGADTSSEGDYTEVEGNSLGVLEFARNETYGQIQGLTLWWLCTEDFVPVDGCPLSVLEDMVIWHTARYAYYGYPGYNYEFRGTRVYGDAAIAAGNNYEFKSVFFFGDYGTTDLLITGARFYDTVGLQPPYFRDGSIRIEDSYLRTRAGIIHRKSAAPGSCPFCDLPDPDTVLDNLEFDPVAGRPLQTISLDDDSTDPDNEDRLIVCRHDGVAGDHFEVFFPSQGNAPCANTRAGIDGFVCVTALATATCGEGVFADSFESAD